MSANVGYYSLFGIETFVHSRLVLTPYMARPKIRKQKNLLSGNNEEEIEEEIEVSAESKLTLGFRVENSILGS